MGCLPVGCLGMAELARTVDRRVLVRGLGRRPDPWPGAGSGKAVEPEGREPAAEEDEDEGPGGEPLGDLLLLEGEADPGAEAGVDRGEVVRGRRLEEARAGDLGNLGQG